MRNTILCTISTVAGMIRGAVVAVVAESVLRVSPKRKRSFYSPSPANLAPRFAALTSAAERAAAVWHQGHDSLTHQTCRGWQPVGVLSGPVC